MIKNFLDRIERLMLDPDLRKNFGRRLKTLRKQNRWTQSELAAKIEIRSAQLNKYECGLHIPPAEKLILLAQIFGTSVDFLLTGAPPGENSLDNHLLERFKTLSGFQDEEKKMIIKFIDAMIIKQRMEGTLRSLAS